MCATLYVFPFQWLSPLIPKMGCIIKDFPPLIVFSSWTSFCLMVCRDGSRIMFPGLFLFSSLISGSCFLMSSDQTQITLICQWPELQREAQKPFYLFFFIALWLYFKLTNTHIHGSLHIYFALTSFCVNLGCWRGLNMAVITGCYESHVFSALLPNVNDCRHRNFHDCHKKPIPRQEKRYECAQLHNCTHTCTSVCHIYCILYIQIQSIVENLLLHANWSCMISLHKYITVWILYYCMDCLPVCVCRHVCFLGCIVRRSCQTPT